MALIGNPARQRLAKGEVSIGMGLRQARTVDIAPIMKQAGYDWLFIDLDAPRKPVAFACDPHHLGELGLDLPGRRLPILSESSLSIGPLS